MKVDLPFYTLSTFLISVLGGKSDLPEPEQVSWISDDDFGKVVEATFLLSECCNVFLNDSIGLSGALFAQFRRIYPYEYLLQRTADECNAYFLLGSSDREIEGFIKRIPSLLWKTEVLVIVTEDFSYNSDILDGSIYGHANVNILSISGVWRLSENYLNPRMFSKLDRYDGMAHDYDHVNFRGKELQVSSMYRPPMTYLNRTINRTIDGVQAEVYVMDNELERDGVEMRVFLTIAEKLNFTFTIRKPEGRYAYGVRVNKTFWQGGMIQMLLENKIDIAFASIWVTLDQNTFVCLSEPWYQLYIHFLVPRPTRTSNFWALGRPFSHQIWILLVSAVIIDCLYTYVRAWIDPRFPKRFRNFLITLTYLIGCLLSTSVPRTMSNNKLQILLWQTAGWLIITAYCSSLAARLASSEYESRVDTVQQFLAANLTWGKTGQTPSFRDYFDLTDPYSAQFPSRYFHIENDAQIAARIGQGNYAIVGKIVDTCFFPDDHVSNADLENYRLMKESVGRFYAAFALQPWLLEPVNRIILRLKESGITVWHLRDIIRRRDNYNLHKVLVERDGYDGSVQVLGLTPLAGGFALLLVGSLIATFAFYLELRHSKRGHVVAKDS